MEFDRRADRQRHPIRDELAVVHLAAGHPPATRNSLSLADLAGETALIAGGGESGGFTDRVLRAFDAAGLTSRTARDPYPDLGLRAVREGIGVVVYVPGAFPAELAGSAFVALKPPLRRPFHLAHRAGAPSRAPAAVLAALRAATPTGA